MTRPTRKLPKGTTSPTKKASEKEEHQAEIVILSAAVPAAERLLPVTGASESQLLDGGRAVQLYRLSLTGQSLDAVDKSKHPSWETQQWGLNTAARILGGLQARWDNVNWTHLRRRHFIALKGVLAARYAPATANRILGGVRSVLEEAWHNGWYNREDLEHVKAVDGVKGSRLPPGRLLEPVETADIIMRCYEDETPRGARDCALFALCYGCGLRRAEAAHMLYERLGDDQLTVIGKGNKERSVPFIDVAAAFVRWQQVRGTAPGPFLCRIHKHGTLLRDNTDTNVPREQRPFAGLQPGGIWEIVWRRSVDFKLDPFTPHDLRRSYITHLLDGGADVVAVQKLVGHSDPRTTGGYDRRPFARLREIAGSLPFPNLKRRS